MINVRLANQETDIVQQQLHVQPAVMQQDHLGGQLQLALIVHQGALNV
jgi:hypothetical protein